MYPSQASWDSSLKLYLIAALNTTRLYTPVIKYFKVIFKKKKNACWVATPKQPYIQPWSQSPALDQKHLQLSHLEKVGFSLSTIKDKVDLLRLGTLPDFYLNRSIDIVLLKYQKFTFKVVHYFDDELPPRSFKVLGDIW